MRSWTIAFLAGNGLLLADQSLPDPMWAQFMMPAGLVLLGRCAVAKLASGLTVGYLLSASAAHVAIASWLPEGLEGVSVQAEGRVISFPVANAKRQRFEFEIESLRAPNAAPWSGRVRISWYRRGTDLPPVRAGERWRFYLKLKRPRGFSNPGTFDYEAWLLHRGFSASGYVEARKPYRKLAPAPPGIPRLRQQLAERISNLLSGDPFTGVIQTLAIGSRSKISTEQWQVFRKTGTGHLMAISGLHIGLVSGFVFWAARAGWRAVPWAVSHVAADRGAAWCALFAATAYAALSGFAIPAQRALIMAAVVLGAKILGIRCPASKALAIAAVAVVGTDPLATLSPSFWLSFAAVALIVAKMNNATVCIENPSRSPSAQNQDEMVSVPRFDGGGITQGLRSAVGLQWLLSLGLTPLIWLYFQEQPIVAPVANLLAVPVVGVLVVPCALLGTAMVDLAPPVAGALFSLAAVVLAQLFELLRWLAEYGFSIRAPVAPSPAALLCATVGVSLLLLPAVIRWRWLGLPWLLPLVLATPARPEAGTFWLSVLDVGQGLAVVVETAEHVLVYDAGPVLGEYLDAGQAAVTPFLRSRGWPAVDRVVLSHRHSDHAGGLRSLGPQWRWPELISNAPVEGWPRKPCRPTRQWNWDGVQFKVLHPRVPGAESGNDASCGLWIGGSAGQALLPGDLEWRGEAHLVARYGEELAAQVVVVPHHGSKTSSTAPFLESVGPRIAIVSRGYKNRFGQPHRSVVSRYRERAIAWYDTAVGGAVEVRFDIGATAPRVTQDRIDRPAFWR